MSKTLQNFSESTGLGVCDEIGVNNGFWCVQVRILRKHSQANKTHYTTKNLHSGAPFSLAHDP
jgi:hypothetical protein